VPESPAEAAGLLDGDEIVSIGKAATRTTQDVIDTVRGHRVGDELTLKVRRGGKTVRLAATLARRMDDLDVLRKLLVDRPAPDFDLAAVEGAASGKLADHAGKVIVVEFFATWCKFCPRAHAELKALAAKQPGIVVLGIAGEDRQKLLDYLDPTYQPKQTVVKASDGSARVVHTEPHHGPTGFTVLFDDGDEVKDAYLPIVTYPTIVVIDGEGFVRDVAVGAATSEIRRVLARARELARD
jgi:thiol-disulfide isomerase/thioredoxin